MMNFMKVFGTVLLVTIVCLSMAACGNGTTTNNPPSIETGPTSTKYESTDDAGNTYILEITKAKAADRAVYTPQNGDTYVLTIITTAGETMKSSGAVNVINTGFKLTPTGSETSFTVITVGALLTGITGTITLTDGKAPVTASGSLIPVKEYEKIEFIGNIWDYADSGELWSAELGKLSDFTTFRPKMGDVLKFRVRGKAENLIEWCDFSIWSCTDGWPEDLDSKYEWLAGGYIGNLSGKFDTTSEVFFELDRNAFDEIYISLNNSIWYRDGNGYYEFYNDGGITQHGKVMATISNFKISLVEVNGEPTENRK